MTGPAATSPAVSGPPGTRPAAIGRTTDLATVARTLLAHYGEEPWWMPRLVPEIAAEDELLLGIVLCQQSRWERVEQVLLRLRDAGLASWVSLATADPEVLAPLLRGAAYPSVRSRRLPSLAAAVLEAGGLARILAGPDPRPVLLALPQVGPETADTLLAFTGTSVPVVDAYLRRVLGRLGLVDPSASYGVLRQQLDQQDTGGVPWGVLHALIVEHGLHHCLTGRPRCAGPAVPRRDYAEPRKCAEHCPPCGGCPLVATCPGATV